MLDVRAKIGPGGRIVIPSALRTKLHISVGDEVILNLKEEGLHITTIDTTLQKLREKIQKANKDNRNLLDDLFNMRREEAELE